MCDYKATTRSHLNRHVQNVHTKEEVSCHDCKKTMEKPSLTRHRKQFHSKEQAKFSCNICTYESIHKDALRTHILNVHQGYKRRTKKLKQVL